MTERNVNINVNLGAKPAALFVQAASRYKSHIELKTDTKTINAKSIMGMFALSFVAGKELTIIADGEDEKQAIDELSGMLTNVS